MRKCHTRAEAESLAARLTLQDHHDRIVAQATGLARRRAFWIWRVLTRREYRRYCVRPSAVWVYVPGGGAVRKPIWEA